MNLNSFDHLHNLEKKIEYFFLNFSLLKQAMMHSSYANEQHFLRSACNERLEFLGDAILELVSSEYLFKKYPKESEGSLTKIRATLVCESNLANCAKNICLSEYLLLGRGEENTGGRTRNSVISDAFEALIGAIYLDAGFDAAKEFICNFLLNEKDEQFFDDSKSTLQEYVQANFQETLSYEIVNEQGPDHRKHFEVCVKLGEIIIGTGKGFTKKAAQQSAAYEGMLSLKNNAELFSKKK
ncbi:ribonuclease 3 [Clostridia bacterium]|nr:ribonuclease 3 [Clostridia bacterium]